MAVYTDVSFEDLEKLLTEYDIGSPRSFKGIAEGVENSNFLLHTGNAMLIWMLLQVQPLPPDFNITAGKAVSQLKDS